MDALSRFAANGLAAQAAVDELAPPPRRLFAVVMQVRPIDRLGTHHSLTFRCAVQCACDLAGFEVFAGVLARGHRLRWVPETLVLNWWRGAPPNDEAHVGRLVMQQSERETLRLSEHVHLVAGGELHVDLLVPACRVVAFFLV
jgi:hypothetical protein